MRSVLNYKDVAKYTEFYLGQLGSMWLPLVMQNVSKKSFTVLFQMLLCGECYENVYTQRHTNYPSLKSLNNGLFACL
jgi:hypothetical protein